MSKFYLTFILTQVILLPSILSVPTNLVVPAVGDMHIHRAEPEFTKNLHQSMHSVHDDDSEIIQRIVPMIPYGASSLLAKLYMMSDDNKNSRKLRSTIET